MRVHHGQLQHEHEPLAKRRDTESRAGITPSCDQASTLPSASPESQAGITPSCKPASTPPCASPQSRAGMTASCDHASTPLSVVPRAELAQRHRAIVKVLRPARCREPSWHNAMVQSQQYSTQHVAAHVANCASVSPVLCYNARKG